MGAKQTDTPPASREQHAAALAASMPDDKAGLLAVALVAVQEQHAAVLAGDDAAASTAAERYEATVWKLNGRGFFGCMGDDDAAGKIIERHCRAVPGAVPMWGQRGEFVIQVEDWLGTARPIPLHALTNPRASSARPSCSYPR